MVAPALSRSHYVYRFMRDKEGKPFAIRSYRGTEQEYFALKAMYDSFEPKECAQGLPTCLEEHRDAWLRSLLGERLNLLAFVENGCVGHAALLEMEPHKSCEYFIFVHQTHQNRGIGTAITDTVRRVAKDLGYQLLWLTVEMTNRRAIHVYEKVGFCRIGPHELECEMVLYLATNGEYL
jgi:ribosomal protein S18 acetylase RimI-like enzyme